MVNHTTSHKNHLNAIVTNTKGRFSRSQNRHFLFLKTLDSVTSHSRSIFGCRLVFSLCSSTPGRRLVIYKINYLDRSYTNSNRCEYWIPDHFQKIYSLWSLFFGSGMTRKVALLFVEGFRFGHLAESLDIRLGPHIRSLLLDL